MINTTLATLAYLISKTDKAWYLSFVEVAGIVELLEEDLKHIIVGTVHVELVVVELLLLLACRQR